MKKLVAIVVALLLVLAAGPWFMGRIAHSRIDKGLDTLASDAPFIRIAERKWTQGWFRSTYLVTFEFRLPGMGGRKAVAFAAAPEDPAAAAPPTLPSLPTIPQLPPIRLAITSKVLHGPLLGSSGIGLARLESHFVISEDIRQKIIAALGTDEPVHITTRMGFLGGGTTTFSGEGRTVALDKLAGAGAGSIAWDDFRLSVGLSRHANSYDIDGRQPRIEYTGGKSSGHVLLSDLKVDGSGSRVTEDLYDGGVNFGIGKVNVATPQTPAFEVQAIKYGVEGDEKGEYFQYALRMGTGAVKNPELEKSGLQLREVHYDMTVRHLHTATLQKLMGALRASTAVAFDDVAAMQSAVGAPLREHGIELLKHDPEFSLDRISIVTPQGEAVLKGVVKLIGVTDEDLQAAPMSLMPKLVADIRFEAPQEMLEKIPSGASLVGVGIDGGYVQREGGKIVSHVEFRNGALTINGKTPKLPQQLGGAPPAPPAQ